MTRPKIIAKNTSGGGRNVGYKNAVVTGFEITDTTVEAIVRDG